MFKRRAFWIIVVAAVLAAGVGAGVLKEHQLKTAPATAGAALQTGTPAALEFLPSDVVQVTPHDLRKTLSASGSLRAINQASVKAKVAGDVREVLVREGETVNAGQVLIRMDAAEYRARLAQAQGALKAARGQLDISAKTRDNNKALLSKGFISQNAFDNAESQYQIALANVESAKGTLDVAQKALGDTVIRAPIFGLISSRSVQPGEKVSPDNRLLDVVDLRQMEMEAAVPTSDIMNIALAQEVQVRVEGLSDALTGKVMRINPATQAGSRSILVYIQIDNPRGALRAGMFGEAQLTLAKKAGALTVPLSAVQTDGGKPTVYAIENGRLAQKPVTLGIHGTNGEGAVVEITSGLDSGAQIIKSNLGNLRAGSLIKFVQPVRPAAAAATATARSPETAQ
jgi:membrane fusion protein (multidrug efflux system)